MALNIGKGVPITDRSPISKITSKSIYEVAIKAASEEFDPNIKENLAAIEYNANKFLEIINELDPYAYFNRAYEPPIPTTVTEDNKYIRIERKTLDCIYSSTTNSVYQKLLSGTKVGIETNENDIYWQIAEMEAIGNFKWLKFLIPTVIDIIFQQLAKIVFIFATGIEKILKVKFSILFVGICINVGVILKAALLRSLYYLLLNVIFWVEDIPSLTYITLRNKKTNQTRTENLYRKKLGSIADRFFYPYFDNKSWPVNSKNRPFLQGMQKTEAVLSQWLSYLFNIVFFKSPRCKELNFDLPEPTFDPIDKITGLLNNPDPKLADLVDKCVQCQEGCYDFNVNEGYASLAFKSSISDLTQDLNANLVDNPYMDDVEKNIFEKSRGSLKDLLSKSKEMSVVTDRYSIISDDFIPASFMNDSNQFFLHAEKTFQAIDTLLEKIKNGNFVDLANLMVEAHENKGDSSGYNKTKIRKEALEKNLIILHNKLSFLQERLDEIDVYLSDLKKEQDKSLVEFHKNPTNEHKHNIKQYDISKNRYEKSINQYKKEMDRVLKDIQETQARIDGNPPKTIQKISGENITTKKQLIISAIVFALDMVCCGLSLLMSLIAKQYVLSPKDMYKLNNNFIYKLLTGKDITGTSVYTAMEWTAEIIDYLISIIMNPLQASLNGAASVQTKFELDFNIVKLLSSMGMTTAFTVLDMFLRQVDESLFAKIALPKLDDGWEAIPFEQSKSIFIGMSQETKNSKFFFNTKDILSLAKKEDGNIVLLFIKNADKDSPEYEKESIKYKRQFGSSIPDYYYVVLLKYTDNSYDSVFDEFMEYLMSQKCLSLNFIFDSILAYIRNFHLRMALMAEILKYEPKFNMEIELNFEVIGKRQSFSLFLDLLKLLFKHFDFFMKFCRLQDDVEFSDKLYQIMMTETKKQECEVYNPRYDNYITSAPVPSDKWDPEAYSKNVDAYENLPISLEQKVKEGDITDQQKKLIEKLYKDIIGVDDTKEIKNTGEDLKP